MRHSRGILARRVLLGPNLDGEGEMETTDALGCTNTPDKDEDHNLLSSHPGHAYTVDTDGDGLKDAYNQPCNIMA